MSGLVLAVVVAVWVATVVLVFAVLAVVRRHGHPAQTGGPPAPPLLDPVVGPTRDALHSEAASLAHQPPSQPGPAASQPPASMAETSEPDRVVNRERRLDERDKRIEEQAHRIQLRAAELDQREEALRQARAELTAVVAQRRREMELVAGMSADEARAALVEDIEAEAKRQAAFSIRDIEHAARQEGDRRARDILLTALQRLTAEQTNESVVSVVQLPGEEMKGRIIGREGRNIRTFEQTTGVNLLVDDTPESVLVSSFDPVRREVARLTLEHLVSDGRIHPSRIEEVYHQSVEEVNRICERAAQDALVEVGIAEVHPRLLALLGQLRFRTSYGQNVLRHLVESAELAGLLADELGLDRELCVRAAFLHDIGKAMTHEAQGSHAAVGADVARRCGESEEVVHAIAAHHNEVEPRTAEAVLTQVADSLSGGRPGARRESLEAYVQRLERLEEIARGCEGVDRVFAMKAGRDLRVMVQPNVVDDIQAQVLARDIAKQVEAELTYPGQIKVTVIRESRATEVAR